jgi:hypothetical protein
LPNFTRLRRPGRDAARSDATERRHPVVARLVTVSAAMVVFVTLVLPYGVTSLPPASFARIPIEGVVGIVVLVVLPPRPRRVVAVLGGVLLGLLTVLRLVDLGFNTVLSRPFNLVSDWMLFGDAEGFLESSVGRAGAIGAAVLAVVLVAAVLVLAALSVLRLARVAAGHRATVVRGATAVGAVWVVLALTGVQFLSFVPVASRTVVGLAYHRTLETRAEIADRDQFARQSRVDAFHDVPGDQLLTSLRGKDVVLTFVESYGRTALQDPKVGAVLDAGTEQLAAAGYSARSAYLTSPVAGAGSWLAHGTLLGGLKINSQQRYDQVVGSDRLTLTKAFQRADWRTVNVMPDTTESWPEDRFFGLDKTYAYKDLDYHGPHFSWATMPDQYALSYFQRTEYAKPGRGPLMAEIVLVSSHAPWQPLPQMVDWNDVGDGSVFNSMIGKGDVPKTVIFRSDPAKVRANYLQSIRYSLSTLISFVTKYGDKNLVLMFLGDHQPYSVVTGGTANRDVPVTIVAHDPAVLDRISGWGWQDGLRPDQHAPVWPMDSLRDRFLTSFGPEGAPTR